jgi:hypothetical protein
MRKVARSLRHCPAGKAGCCVPKICVRESQRGRSERAVDNAIAIAKSFGSDLPALSTETHETDVDCLLVEGAVCTWCRRFLRRRSCNDAASPTRGQNMDELHLPPDLYRDLLDQSNLKLRNRIRALRRQPDSNRPVVGESWSGRQGRQVSLLQQLAGEWFR